MNYDLIIVGGGASGLVCAIETAKKQPQWRIALLEASDTFGKKIRISGNGKCNIANTRITPKRFLSHRLEFIERVLKGYDFQRIKTWLYSIGIELIEEQEGRCYPRSKQASFVAETLVFYAQKYGVALLTEHPVTAIRKEAQGFTIQVNDQTFHSRYAVIAAGSPAAPQLGGNTSALDLAASLGHRIITPLPALVQLETDPKPKRASGVRLKADVTLRIDGEARQHTRNDVLFADYGLSGLAILDLSTQAVLALHRGQDVAVQLDLAPQWDLSQLRAYLASIRDPSRAMPASLWLQRLFPKKLVRFLLETEGLIEATEASLDKKALARLSYRIKDWRFCVTQSRGFKGAEAASGGVDTTHIDPKTMASTCCEGLYLIGEAVDVVGDRGGFNFHFAFTSALRAATALASCV